MIKEGSQMIKERLSRLREEMKKRDITIYIVPTADYHESEYVNDYFKARAFLTGFTGSAGTAVITSEEAGLWTDGRYFIQAQRQLSGSGFTLFKAGNEGVPKVTEYVEQCVREQAEAEICPVIGFDGRVINAKDGVKYQQFAEATGGRLVTDEDLVDLIWEDRPAFPHHPAFLLEEQYAGASVEEKLVRVREQMQKNHADYHVLTSLCDIAWLLNIRGNDISHVPVVISYLLLDLQDCYWYVHPSVLTDEIRAYLTRHHITPCSYDSFYQDIGRLPATGSMLLETGKINTRLLACIPEGMQILDAPNPEEGMKAVKNETEIRNTIAAHVKDGVAYVKFCHWLKTRIGKEPMTEVSAAAYLDRERALQEHFVDISFDTISAYGANAAMMHYAPESDNNTILEEKGFLLVDSGGHYLEGSTDITRNIVLGPLTDEEKEMYTAVLRGNLQLAHAKFLYGCCGQNLDILARGPLWQKGIDYKCGTGHGNGYLLNVHEGPNGFRWKIVPERKDDGKLEAGMITTNEPGVYVEGKYGIRIENELLCRQAEKNEYGQFMEFETITYAPIDLDAVLPEQMTQQERDWLNTYHEQVYQILSPYLSEPVNTWLRHETRAI